MLQRKFEVPRKASKAFQTWVQISNETKAPTRFGGNNRKEVIIMKQDKFELLADFYEFTMSNRYVEKGNKDIA